MQETEVKNQKNEKLKKENAITLIALVVTIVVLLILAGVSIATLTGNNGILIQANTAKEKTEKATIIEQARTDILGKQAENKSGKVTREDLKEVLDKYFKDVPEDYTLDTLLTTKKEYGNYQILVSDIYIGEFEKLKENISTIESYVGYYADVDGDKEPDGIIYADLAVGGSGTWNNDSWSSYSYSAETGLKDYYISKTGYEGKFGTKDVLSTAGTGKDRFYVMALEDFDTNTHYWYYNASGKLDRPVATNYNDFSEGKANTLKMIDDYTNKTSTYGAQNSNDLWKIIQNNGKYDIVTNTSDTKKWFVPSKAEWAAFGDFLYTELGVTTSNYGDFGLSDWYWSSSQGNANRAYTADFDGGYITSSNVNLRLLRSPRRDFLIS